VNAGAQPFRAAYASALLGYLLEPTEASLRAAYELAREAVRRRLSVLDLAVAHQEAVMAVLADASDAEDVQAIARAAGDFFLEGLSTFDMVQRGYAEAREAALLERRQTRLSRQLSTFLADTSLALDAPDSLDEMLRLVAEQARELVGADCCLVTVAVSGQPRVAEGASYPEDEKRWTTFIRWLDLTAIYRLIHQSGGSARVGGEQLDGLPAIRGATVDRPAEGWLAASLTALDGTQLGAIQLFDKQGGRFTVEDEAVLVHLAQMTSAAVERARLYQERG
jgi:GAF domain-containing protein